MKLVPNLLIFFYWISAAYSQDSNLNKYGLQVIKDKRTFIETVKSDKGKEMIDLKKAVNGVILDMRYATPENFMHEKLYFNTSTTYMRRPAAIALQQVQKELKQHGLGLKIFDAYRPYSITEKMWELVKDDQYAADPKKGSGHNRGVAADITIVNLVSGKELNMGTAFDNFSDTAHHDFKYLPEDILRNRSLLRSIMEKQGFKSLESEWWHYSLPNATDFELLDISFKDLRTLIPELPKRKGPKNYSNRSTYLKPIPNTTN